jgi:hypothetical protein
VGLGAGKGEGGEAEDTRKDFVGGERPMQGSRPNRMSKPKSGEAGRLDYFEMRLEGILESYLGSLLSRYLCWVVIETHDFQEPTTALSRKTLLM